MRDDEGDLQDRRAEAMFALVPDVDNTTTGGFPVVLGFASYDFDYGKPGADMPSWMDPFTFRVQLCSWEQLHYAAQKSHA